MKKVILSSLAVCSIALLAGGMSANAAEVGATTTDGFIQFNPDKDGGGGTTDPGDPGDGDDGSETEVNPGDPGGDGGESTAGPLRLVYVPNFDFGAHKISYSSAGNTYYASYQATTPISNPDEEPVSRPSFFVVRDLRGGTDGWNVTLSNNQQLVNDADPTDILNVQFSIQNMFVTNTEGFSTDALTLANTGTSAYTTLTDTATTMVTAPSGSGAGTYSVLLGTVANANEDGTNPGVRLFIPKNQVISDGTYKTTLNWAINDTL